MDVKLLHPRWKDFLDTVNTVVLTGYWKQLIIFLFDLQCFFQSGSECGPWTKMIGNSSLVIQKIHLVFFMIFFIFNGGLYTGVGKQISRVCIYGYCIRCGFIFVSHCFRILMIIFREIFSKYLKMGLEYI